MINTTIYDPLGLDTGIKITNVRSVLDKEGDRIIITGRMTSDRIIGLDVEPDLQCEVFNQKDQICLPVQSIREFLQSPGKCRLRYRWKKSAGI